MVQHDARVAEHHRAERASRPHRFDIVEGDTPRTVELSARRERRGDERAAAS
jgi:hypothetical protein